MTQADQRLCPYCGIGLHDKLARRCSDCGSWLSLRSYFFYPESIQGLIGLSVSILAAMFAWYQALEARSERRAAEALRQDIGVVAQELTKMAFVLGDGSRRFGGIPSEHLDQINEYKKAMAAYLPSEIDGEIQNTLRELDEKIKRRNTERR